MPTHNGITLTLHSQYDAAPIEEYETRVSSSAITRASESLTDDYAEAIQHTSKPGAIITTSILALPRSQFWISYRCHEPTLSSLPSPSPSGTLPSKENTITLAHSGFAPPESAAPTVTNACTGIPDVKHVFFQLLAPSAPVISWGTSPSDQWRGKMMFGLFDAGTDFEGRRVVEKRGMYFSYPCGDRAEGFEVRVFRVRARRRVGVEYEGFSGGGREGMEFTPIGRKHRGERQRMYEYALIDAKDEPLVTFRYYFCTADGLRASRLYPAASPVSGIGDDDYEVTGDEDLAADTRPTSPTIRETLLWRPLPPLPPPSPVSTILEEAEESEYDDDETEYDDQVEMGEEIKERGAEAATTGKENEQHREGNCSSPPLLTTTAAQPPSTLAPSFPSPTLPPARPSTRHTPSPRIHRANSHHKRTSSPIITLSAADSDEQMTVHRPDGVRTPSPTVRREFAFEIGGQEFGVSPGTPPSQRRVVAGKLLRGVVESALKRSLMGARGAGR